MRTGVYPGSFNPPTVAHLAVARAALEAGRLERVDLCVSELPLGKEHVTVPSIDDRMAVLDAMAANRPWLGARRSPHRLLVDLAEGYDALVVGADKWAQLLDPVWYGGSVAGRDAALARLPTVLVVPRPPHPAPGADGAIPDGAVDWMVVPVDDPYAEVSSSAVRAGRREWMAPEAVDWDRRTGAWSEPVRHRTGSPDGGGA